MYFVAFLIKKLIGEVVGTLEDMNVIFSFATSWTQICVAMIPANKKVDNSA